MFFNKILKTKNRFRAYPTPQAVQTSGSTAHNWESLKPERLLESVRDPYIYKHPFSLSFIDLKQEELAGEIIRIKGISEHLSKDENTPGPNYRATCELKVLQRIDHMPKKEQVNQNADHTKKK